MRRRAFDVLTPREQQVWALIAEGCSNAAIAGRLFVTERAIEKHVGEVLWKVTGRFDTDLTVNRRVLAATIYLASRMKGAA